MILSATPSVTIWQGTKRNYFYVLGAFILEIKSNRNEARAVHTD
jgi:hypothetical protein